MSPSSLWLLDSAHPSPSQPNLSCSSLPFPSFCTVRYLQRVCGQPCAARWAFWLHAHPLLCTGGTTHGLDRPGTPSSRGQPATYGLEAGRVEAVVARRLHVQLGQVDRAHADEAAHLFLGSCCSCCRRRCPASLGVRAWQRRWRWLADVVVELGHLVLISDTASPHSPHSQRRSGLARVSKRIRARIHGIETNRFAEEEARPKAVLQHEHGGQRRHGQHEQEGGRRSRLETANVARAEQKICSEPHQPPSMAAALASVSRRPRRLPTRSLHRGMYMRTAEMPIMYNLPDTPHHRVPAP